MEKTSIRRMYGGLLVAALLLATPSTAQTEARPGEPVKVICIGNSITNGGGVYSSYPANLGKLLDKTFGAGVYKVVNYGVGGATLSKQGNKPYWEQAVMATAKNSNPDIVIIKFGTNDAKPYNWSNAKDTYADDLAEMVRTFQELPSQPKVYVGIPVWVCKDNYNISGELLEREVTPAIRRTAVALDADTIDFYSVLKGKAECYMDGIHPNEVGADLLADQAMKAITAGRPAALENAGPVAMDCPACIVRGGRFPVKLVGADGLVATGRIYGIDGGEVSCSVSNGGLLEMTAPGMPGIYLLHVTAGMHVAVRKIRVE